MPPRVCACTEGKYVTLSELTRRGGGQPAFVRGCVENTAPIRTELRTRVLDSHLKRPLRPSEAEGCSVGGRVPRWEGP